VQTSEIRGWPWGFRLIGHGGAVDAWLHATREYASARMFD
jgi:hypothetical protein